MVASTSRKGGDWSLVDLVADKPVIAPRARPGRADCHSNDGSSRRERAPRSEQAPPESAPLISSSPSSLHINHNRVEAPLASPSAALRYSLPVSPLPLYVSRCHCQPWRWQRLPAHRELPINSRAIIIRIINPLPQSALPICHHLSMLIHTPQLIPTTRIHLHHLHDQLSLPRSKHRSSSSVKVLLSLRPPRLSRNIRRHPLSSSNSMNALMRILSMRQTVAATTQPRLTIRLFPGHLL